MYYFWCSRKYRKWIPFLTFVCFFFFFGIIYKLAVCEVSETCNNTYFCTHCEMLWSCPFTLSLSHIHLLPGMTKSKVKFAPAFKGGSFCCHETRTVLEMWFIARGIVGLCCCGWWLSKDITQEWDSGGGGMTFLGCIKRTWVSCQVFYPQMYEYSFCCYGYFPTPTLHPILFHNLGMIRGRADNLSTTESLLP